MLWPYLRLMFSPFYHQFEETFTQALNNNSEEYIYRFVIKCLFHMKSIETFTHDHVYYIYFLLHNTF